ncbi:MAG TPA: Ig-like domain-containing protein, partial [Cytophagaceae bacterium]
MKRKLLLLFGLMISITTYSQEWYDMLDDPNLNFYEIQEKFYKYFENRDKGRGTGWKQFKRWEYIMKDRIDENGNIIGDRVGWNEVARFKSEAAKKRTGAVSAGNWTELGPREWNSTSSWNPGIGRVTCIAVDKKNTNVIYVGSPGGGLWKTTVGGNNWIPLTDNLPVMEVFSVEIDPNNSNVVYMGTAGGGILKSTNAGASWVQATAGISSNARINRILVDPTNSNILIAATTTGMYRSTNGGVSWSLTANGEFNDAEFKPGNTSIVHATGDRYFRSTNNGVSYIQITNGLPNAGRAFVSVTPANPNYVYVVQARGSEFGWFYRSVNSGDSFTTMVTGSPSNGTNYFGYSPNGTDTGGQAWYDMAMCVSTTNADEVYIGGIIIWKTTNGGSSFTAMTEWIYPNSRGYTHPDMHALEYVNGVVYSGSDGGIYKSTNAGDDWTDLSKGLGIRQFYRIGCSKTDPNMISGGAQDNGTSILKSTGWIDWLGADGMETIIDHTNPNIVYGTTQNGGLNKSINGGQSRTGISTPSGNGNWVTPWVMDKSNSSTLYLGYNEVFKTTNGGSSWTKISNFGGSSGLDALEVAPSNSNYIYASKGSTIWRTTNGGGSWTNISSGLSGSITYITVHPTNPQKIAVSTTGGSKVFVSSNAGSSWTNYTANLPNISSNCVVFQAENDGLYVGMGVGVYYRDNTMNEWVSFMSNLPNVSVRELEIHEGTKKIRAATYGRGLWESPLYSTQVALRNPENPANTESGLEYSYYHGTWDNLPNFAALTPVKKGDETNFNLGQRTQNDNFGFVFTGFIDVPTDGQYTFYTTSDDGSRLLIGTTVVVDNDGLHGSQERSGTIGLKKGKHAITVEFFEKGGDEVLSVSYAGPGITKRAIPNNVLYRKGNVPPTVSITAPSNNASFIEGSLITISANASDPDGSVSKVEFFHGSTLIATDNSSPYSITWANVPAGTYALTAKAYDNKNGVTTSSVVNITVTPLRNPDNPANTVSGIEYSYFEGSWNNLPSFTTLTPLKTGYETNFSLAQRNRNDDFGFMFHGYIDIPTNGLYTFYTTSDDGSRLFIGTGLVVDNDGLHGSQERSGSIGLKAGKHEIYVTFFERGGDEVLSVSFEGPGISKQTIPSSRLYRVKTENTSPVVSITNPSNGAQFTQGATINFEASASDPDGSITKVAFMRGNDTLHIDYTAPYTAAWSNAPVGTHTITAVAVDNQGAATTSAPITIVVNQSNVNQLPNVSITSPANNSTFTSGSNITINATASDPDGSVTKVEFFAGTTLLSTDVTSPYSFTWNNVPAGTYQLTAVATDNKGATKTSSVVTITVENPNINPTVTITSPSNNSSFNAGSNITINATASDADGSVTKVEFFAGSTLLGTDATSPYSFTWNNVPAGTYQLTAVATDNKNGKTTSSVVNITVVRVNAKPTVSITSPANNASFTAGSNITFTANASDDVAVTNVSFYRGSTLI